MKTKIILTALCVLSVWQTEAQTYDTNNVAVQTFAGSGFSGYLDGQGTQTMFNLPMKVVADSSGNLFVLDFYNSALGYGNSLIRKITPAGTVSTFAASGAITYYSGMTIDHFNVLWIPTSSGLLRVGSDASVSIRSLTGLTFTSGICVDSGNNIYYTAPDLNQIYRWRTNGVLEVFAGSGNSGSIDGNGIFTSFHYPTTLAADAADNIYVWDSGNYLIRKINQNKDVVTIAGKNGVSSLDTDGVGLNAAFSSISAMCVDNAGNVILACYGTVGSSIRKMDSAANVTTIAGSFTQTGYANGTGSLARFWGSSGVCVSRGLIFVADSNNYRIRQIGLNPAPVIRRQPQPQVSCLGQSASFQVIAAGVQPLFYQWLSNSVPIAGQTSSNLFLTNLVSSQAGAYSVIVSNAFCAVTSDPAQLVINDACVDIRLYAGLNMSGQPGASYLLSYTTNLTAPINWLPLATNTMPISGWLYIDTNTPFSPQRFYRAALQP